MFKDCALFLTYMHGLAARLFECQLQVSDSTYIITHHSYRRYERFRRTYPPYKALTYPAIEDVFCFNSLHETEAKELQSICTI